MQRLNTKERMQTDQTCRTCSVSVYMQSSSESFELNMNEVVSEPHLWLSCATVFLYSGSCCICDVTVTVFCVDKVPVQMSGTVKSALHW